MALFKNQNFVTQLAQHYGIQEELDPRVSALVQALVESETRRLLETAIKFMHAGRREQLLVDDIECALQYMSLKDMHLIPTEDRFEKQESGSLRQDRMCTDVDAFVKEQLRTINHLFRRPEIKVQWIYINGRVPRTQENIHIRNFSEILELKSKQLEQRTKKFNIIKDQPLSLLSIEEEEFFKWITSQLERGVVPQIPSTNLNNIFLLLINYFMSAPITDPTIVCFLSLLNNPYVERMIEHYLHSILIYLGTYQGIHAWQVGLKMASLIMRWRHKYRNIVTAFDLPQDTYCQKIKKLAFEIVSGMSMNVSVETLDQDVAKNVPMAEHFLYLVSKCSRKFRYFCNYHKLLPEGLVGIESDCYLEMQL